MAVSKFGKAFAAARKAGKKEFSFGGKRFTTETREEKREKATGSKVPTPTPAPRAKSGASRSAEGKVSAKSGAARSASGKVTAKPRERADYPKPAKQVGIAKPGSRISKAIAKKENRPMAKTQAMIDEAKKKKMMRSGGGGY